MEPSFFTIPRYTLRYMVRTYSILTIGIDYQTNLLISKEVIRYLPIVVHLLQTFQVVEVDPKSSLNMVYSLLA